MAVKQYSLQQQHYNNVHMGFKDSDEKPFIYIGFNAFKHNKRFD